MVHRCDDCTFVANSESIFAGWTHKTESSEKPRRLGCFTLPNWNGHSDFYLFKCSACGVACVDYPHGYTSDGVRDGLLYFSCHSCEAIKPLYDKEIYKSSGLPSLPTFWDVLKEAWAMRKMLKNSKV